MAATTTGKDTPATTSRKDGKAIHGTSDSISEPLLPVEESKSFTYGTSHCYPSTPMPFYNHQANISLHLPDPASTSLQEVWAPTGTGLTTLNTIISFSALPFRALVFAFHILDSALAYLRYPLLGTVILSLLYGHLSDVYPHEHDGNSNTSPRTITLTTTVTKTRTSTVYPISSPSLSTSAQAEELGKGSTEVSIAENTVKLSTVTILGILSAAKTGSASDAFSSLSSEAMKNTAEGSSSVMSIATTLMSSVEFSVPGIETSTGSSEKTIIAGSPSPSSGPARSTTQKKRMYH
ncbi:hypothetical protein DL98DRAFT_582875 [Cadophora sp. DSE1049]|nr:hypothetical protein DL98DRAFT_582875 [Cadophora sp. DSE1049]